MSLSVTLSNYTFNADTTTQVTLTVSGATSYQGECGFIISEDNDVELSLDNTTFSDEVAIPRNGTYTLYVRIGDYIAGTYSNILYYDFLGMDNPVAFEITIAGATIPFESVSFSFSPRESTVQFNANTVNGNSLINVKQTLSGSILDYNYNFQIERIVEQGDRASISGATLAEKLAHSLIIYEADYDWDWHYFVWERPTFNEHLQEISAKINVPIVLVGDDFTPKTDQNLMLKRGWNNVVEVISGSFSSLIEKLIGWSDTVPSMVYNLYINNGTIYIVQRGHETNNYTPTNWVMHPTITHTVRRTEWSNSASQTTIPKQIASSDAVNSNTPFDGQITFGNCRLTYSNGLLTQEEHGDVSTAYTYSTYDGNKYLTQKIVTDSTVGEEKSISTTYTYEASGVDYYLFEEDTEEYDTSGVAQGGSPEREKGTLIRHVPLGNGYYGTTVYDTTDLNDIVEVSSSISQGAPGNKVSQKMIDDQQDSIKPSNSGPRQLTVPLNGVARARQTYPVADSNTLQDIADCLDDYEGAEEITLQGELVGGNHVFTYHDTITYDNETYYLVSNNVSRNYNTIRQSITAVRWVLPT